MVLEDIRKYAQVFGKGFSAQMAPGVVKGMIIEILREIKISVAKVSVWVENNESLWSKIPAQYQDRLKKFAGRIGSPTWFTTSWVIDAIRVDYPALASLFLGWIKGRNWLERQITEIKKEIVDSVE